MDSKEIVMTVEETAEFLRISRPSAYLAVKRGDLPIIRIGRRILVPVAALNKMLESAGKA